MPPATTQASVAVVRREPTASASTAPVRLGGLSLAFGGVLFAFFGIVFFRYTHGPTGSDQEGALFGLGGTAYGRMEVLWPALLLAGLTVTHRVLAGRLGRWGRRGLNVALLSQALMIAAVVMQWWLKDGHNAEDFASVTLTLGFYLGALSCLLLSVGMCLFGLSGRRQPTHQWPTEVPVLIGLLALPTAVVELMGMSVAGVGDDLVMSAVRLPLSVCWILFGWSLYSRAEGSRRGAGKGRPNGA